MKMGLVILLEEFWRFMNCLTSHGNWELRIDYQLYQVTNGTKSHLYYKQFAM